jgi:uncharacterized protein YcbK (DUF882 family)
MVPVVTDCERLTGVRDGGLMPRKRSTTLMPNSAMTRRALLSGLTGMTMIAAAPAFASAPAILTGVGDFRRLHMVNARTGEWLNTIYWVEGDYITDALQAVDHIMRDWREDLVHKISPRTIDILSAAHRLLDCSEPIHVLSGYRSPKTNALLRRQTRGVALNSYHIKGMAADIRLKTRSVEQISRAGLSLRAGGVGRYSHSEFVHLDSGPVRDWGR